MKKVTLSVPVYGIRLVSGKTFGFARLADRGGDAFIPPPLMWEVEGKVPPHAIVEMAEKGQRVVRFLDKPEIELVWEGKPDEKRMIALAPEIARRWVDFREAHPGDICAVSDYSHEEFSSLWSAACAAGEAEKGKFLAELEVVLGDAKRAEITSWFERLFAEWQKTLAVNIQSNREKLLKEATRGYDYRPEGGVTHTPWWLTYTSADQQAKVLDISGPLSYETNRLVTEALAAKKAADDEAHRVEMVRRVGIAGEILTKAGNKTAGVTAEEIAEGWQCGDNKLAGTFERLRKERLGAALKEWAASRTLKCGEMVTSQGAWYDHEDIGCGMMGGDYWDVTKWVWEPWAKRALEIADNDLSAIPAACEQARVEEDRAALASDISAIRKWQRERWHSWHVPTPKTEEGKEFLRRVEAMRARAAKRRKEAELILAGLRAEEARRAAESEAEEKRFRDIAIIRRNWRTIDTVSWRARSARNGGRSGYHPDALALLEKIQGAQRRAEELARPRKMAGEQARWKEKTRRAEEQTREREHQSAEAARRKAAERDSFLSGGAWDKLDGIKL